MNTIDKTHAVDIKSIKEIGEMFKFMNGTIGIHKEQQRLWIQGHPLNISRPLRESNIQRNSTIEITLRVNGVNKKGTRKTDSTDGKQLKKDSESEERQNEHGSHRHETEQHRRTTPRRHGEAQEKINKGQGK